MQKKKVMSPVEVISRLFEITVRQAFPIPSIRSPPIYCWLSLSMVIILGVYESTITSQVIRVSNPQSFTNFTHFVQNKYQLINETN